MYSLTSFYFKKKNSNPVLVFVLFFVLLVVLFYSQELFGLATKKKSNKVVREEEFVDCSSFCEGSHLCFAVKEDLNKGFLKEFQHIEPWIKVMLCE